MRNTLLVFILLLSWSLFAQPQNPLMYSFSSAGGATGTGSIPTYFASVGQPMVYARPSKFNNGGGVLNVTNYLFTSGSSGDLIAPVITFTASPGPSIIEGQTIIIDVTITDNVNVAKGILFYRPITGGTFTQLELTRPVSGNIFTTTLPAETTDNMGLEFYFEAQDANNRTIAPGSGGKYYSYFTFNPAVMPVFAQVGSDAKNYRIMSLPLNMTNRNPSNIYNELSEITQKTIRVWSYDPSEVGNEWLEYPDFTTMDHGKGYFVILGENKNFEMGSQKAPSNNWSNLYKMTLKPGWNLIGNPYTVSIDWDDVKAYNNDTTNNASYMANVGALKYYTGTGTNGYTSPTVLEAYKGAFVFLNGSSSLTFDIPFGYPAPSGRTKREIFDTDLGSSNWKLPLNIRQGELESSLNGIGMHPDANISYDQFDDLNPPSFLKYATIGFLHPEHTLGAFALDVAPTTNEYIWRFKVDGNNGVATELFWSNTDLGNNPMELYLYDIRENKIVNMREENQYAFSTGQSKEFKVYYGQNMRERIGPDEITVDEPYPNPFSLKDPLKFVVGLPDNLMNTSYPVEMVIRNSVGIQVHSQSQTLTPGLHTLTWTGHKSDNEMQPAGFYFYTIKVGARSFTGKVIFTNQNN